MSTLRTLIGLVLVGLFAIPTATAATVLQVRFREGVDTSRPSSLLPMDLAALVDSIEPLFSLSPAQLSSICSEGERRSGRKLPDLRLWFRITPVAEADVAKLLESLQALDSVDVAEVKGGEALTATPDLESHQGYVESAPAGVDAPYSWRLGGGNGQGVTIYDVGKDWSQNPSSCCLAAAPTHDDLSRFHGLPLLVAPGDAPGLTGSGTGASDRGGGHGVATLGILVADNDGEGMTGISWGASVMLVPYVTERFPGSIGNAASAISVAVADARAGDVISLEIGSRNGCGVDNSLPTSGAGPAEWDSAVFDVVSVGVANGITIIQTAGNAGLDLDDSSCLGRFDRAIRDSGAIIVGAGLPPRRGPVQTGQPAGGDVPPFPKLSRSPVDSTDTGGYATNFGSRVDVQGWGLEVATLGWNGDLFRKGNDPLDVDFWYTSSFDGTSSAAPMVTGVVANLQGFASRRFGASLDPLDVRQLLVETGTPQNNEALGHIGPLPNLRAALESLLARPLFRPVAGEEIVIAGGTVGSTITWRAEDPAIVLGLPNSPDDPTCQDDSTGTVKAWLRFTGRGLNGSDSRPIPLPCERWEELTLSPSLFDWLLGRETDEFLGWRYSDPQRRAGVCTRVEVRDGEVLADCGAKERLTAFALQPGLSQRSVAARLRLGQLRLCTEFPAADADGSNGKLFVGGTAPPPRSCRDELLPL